MRCSIGGIRREFMDRFAVACCGLPIPSTPRCAGASAWPDMGRLHQRSCLILGAFWLVLPGTVWASPPDMEVLLTGQVETDASGEQVVALRFLNRTDRQEILALPDRIEAKVRQENRERTLLLARANDTEPHLAIDAHGFGQAHYRLPANEPLVRAMVSIPAWSTQEVVLAPIVKTATHEAENRSNPNAPILPPPPTDRKAGNAFVDNLDLYEPIYAVYGPGTDSEARIQLSFKYRLFGASANSQTSSNWRDGLYLAYTQRMFWDLESKSSPFRNIDFQPELIYITPTVGLTGDIAMTVQAGIRHESNGRDGPQSRSSHSIYIAPMATLPIAGDRKRTRLNSRH